MLFLGILAGPERTLAQRPLGIDVSHWQGTGLNWASIKSSGITFAYCKASEGTGYTDDTFAINEANAKAAGVLIGAYHYADFDINTGTNGAIAEANHFWSVAKNYIKGGGTYLMPMLDLEASRTGYTKTTLSQWANTWCITVSNSAAAVGITVKPVIYTSSSFASSWLDSTMTKWTPWIAAWPTSPNPQTDGPSSTAPWSTWTFWQYADNTTVPGHTGNVDGDVFKGTLAGLAAYVVGGTPPAITNQPASQTLSAGASATFTVGASGSTPLSYQWRFNGGNISGATSTSYTRSNVQIGDAGSYSVLVTNSFGSSNSANAVLTVHAPPIITGQPTNTYAGLGLSASLRVTVTGTAPLSYQWRHNSTNLTSATASSLTFASVQTTDAGTYSVVVTNLYGTATSLSVLLGVTDPYITNQPQSLTVAVGAPATFTVGAGGTAPLAYFWSKDSVGLTNGANIGGASSSSLTVSNVQAGNVGTYSVIISNLNGWVVSSNAMLVAALAPAIATQPASQQVLAGSTVSLGVGVVGPSPIAFQWQKDGTNLSNGGDISGAATASLIVSNAQAADMGNYSVIVTNANGGIASSNALLTVWPLLGWGRNDYGQADIPGGLTGVTNIAGGLYHNLALRAEGTVAAWGAGTTNSGVSPNFGQSIVPSGLTGVTAIAAGYYHGLALRTDGTVAAWGAGTTNTGVSPHYGQAVVPSGLSNVVAVAAGAYHSLALKSDGTVVAWGAGTNNSGSSLQYGQALVPAGLTSVAAVAAGGYHSLALKSDGTVVAWGYNNFGQTNVPGGLTGVVAMAGGGYHSLALRSDGTVAAWGNNNSGQTNVPSRLTNIVAVSGGFFNSLSLQADGTVAAWGNPNYNLTNAPSGLANVVKIAGGAYHNLVLENDGRPALSVEPVGQVAAAGITVRLSAMAAGLQPLTYQWQSNGTNIPGATNATLSLTNVQFADAGTYSVVASNAAGTDASPDAVLTVLSPPVVSVQPADQTVVTGAPATFTIEAAGSTPLGYQWQFNSANIAGATDSDYNLASATPTNAGTYSVVVSNAYGSAISSNAVLSVLTAPSIITQPTNQTVVANATVDFTVQASSAAPPDYQWYFNQTNLLADTDAATLSLTNVLPARAGDYSVVVHNVAGSVTSLVARLTVLVPPTITNQPASQTVNAGSPFAFSVGGTGSDPLGYQWLLNSTAIPTATQSSYSRLSAQPGDAGSYSVILTNAAGSVTSAVATLIVVVPTPPGILSAPIYETTGGVLQFNVAGDAGSNYVVESSTNLTDWIPRLTNTSPFSFTDTNAVDVLLRAYRAHPAP